MARKTGRNPYNLTVGHQCSPNFLLPSMRLRWRSTQQFARRVKFKKSSRFPTNAQIATNFSKLGARATGTNAGLQNSTPTTNLASAAPLNTGRRGPVPKRRFQKGCFQLKHGAAYSFLLRGLPATGRVAGNQKGPTFNRPHRTGRPQ